jgi:hypothetical protein
MTDQIPVATELSEPVFAEPDPTVFIDRYPTPNELLYRGGKEGIEYCLVAGERIGYFSRLKNEDGDSWSLRLKNEDGDSWSLIKSDRNSETVPTITIRGPKGVDESVVLMACGKPIPGSDDHNGVRRFYVDTVLEEKVGIPANPKSPVSTTNLPDPKQVQADSEDGRKRSGAALGKKGSIQVIEEGKGAPQEG